MASLTTRKDGNRELAFIDGTGVRRHLYLGKTAKKVAESIRSKIEALNSAKIAGHSVDNDTAAWLSRIEPSLAKKLAKVGLIETRESQILADFLHAYVTGREDVKGATRVTYGNVKRNLLTFFDASKPLKSFTAADGERFATFLKVKEGLSSNTVRRRIGIARQFFRRAMKDRLIDSNPFEGISASVQANPAKAHFVSREDTKRILDACPDVQWRLLVALARYAGVRVPSEPLAMRWEHVSWESGRMTIPSPKTEGKGKPFRVCPIFPELRPFLEDALELCPKDNPWLIHRYREPGQNLRTQLLKIMARAGVKPWPKLWVNMRSSRATELANEYPSHVAADWLGHTEAIANAHYRQTTEEHFESAVGGVETVPSGLRNNSAFSTAARNRQQTFKDEPDSTKPLENPLYANFSDLSQSLTFQEHWAVLDSNQ